MAVKILDENVRRLLDKHSNVVTSVKCMKEEMGAPPRPLPFRTDDSPENSMTLARMYWNAYMKDPTIGIARIQRERLLFNGWSASLESMSETGETLVNEKPSPELMAYMDEVMTPFFKKAFRFIDCFGLVPFRFERVKGCLQPIIPELDTFSVEVWLTKSGQQRYTFIDLLASADEDPYGRGPLQADNGSDSDSDEIRTDGTRFITNTSKYGFNVNAYINPDPSTTGAGRIDEHGKHHMGAPKKPHVITMEVSADQATALKRQREYDLREGSSDEDAYALPLFGPVTKEHVHAARLRISHIQKVREDVGINNRKFQRHTKGNHVFLNMDKLNVHEVTNKYASQLVRMKEEHESMMRDIQVVDITQCVFFIVESEPDYYSAQFNSIMSTMFESVCKAIKFVKYEDRVADETSKRKIAVQENGKAVVTEKESDTSALINAEHKNLDRTMPIDYTEAVTHRTMGISNGALMSDAASASRDARAPMFETKTSEASRRNRERVAAVATAMNLANSLGETRDQTGRGPLQFDSITHAAPPGTQFARLDPIESKVDFYKSYEYYVQMVAVQIGITSSAMMESLSSGKMGGGGAGMANMHTQTVDVNMTAHENMVCKYARMIFRMMVNDMDASQLNLSNISIPYDHVYIKRHGKLEPYVSPNQRRQSEYFGVADSQLSGFNSEPTKKLRIVQMNAAVEHAGTDEVVGTKTRTELVKRQQSKQPVQPVQYTIHSPVFPDDDMLSTEWVMYKKTVEEEYTKATMQMYTGSFGVNDQVSGLVTRNRIVQANAAPAVPQYFTKEQSEMRSAQRSMFKLKTNKHKSDIKFKLSRYNTTPLESIMSAAALGVFDPFHITKLIAERIGLSHQHIDQEALEKMKKSKVFPATSYEHEQKALQSKSTAK